MTAESGAPGTGAGPAAVRGPESLESPDSVMLKPPPRRQFVVYCNSDE
jgi:hypothetical protein